MRTEDFDVRRPFIRSRHGSARRRGQHGVTMVLVAMAMVAIIAMAALSIDVVTLYLARAEAQRAADSGALAAARIVSLSGVTGDPTDSPGGLSSAPWPSACALARKVGQAVAAQNTVGGTAATTVNVTFLYNGTTTDCTSAPGSGAFAVNPQVQVQVIRQSLPTFFSRIWSRGANSVSASATAEAFNSSNSGNFSASGIIPVQPRCVKPWIVPNRDPGNAGNPFVDRTNGSIQSAQIRLSGGGAGVIGEEFTLFPDCRRSPNNCNLRNSPPVANLSNFGTPWIPNTPNLEYLPGLAANASVAIPSCAVSSSPYENAIEGCDQTTVYACGVRNANAVDLRENPGQHTGDTANGVQCLINQGGQDTLDTTSFPFQIKAGSGNPLVTAGIATNSVITSSNSIVSLPIYDTAPITSSSNPVTIVGFLQVFINNVDTNGWGNVDVTVLNVVGCGNGTDTTGGPVLGSSPVPVRLIMPP